MHNFDWWRSRAISRREYLKTSALLAGSALVASCDEPTAPGSDGRLAVTRTAPTSTIEPGTYALGIATGSRDGKLYVPTSYTAAVAAPLLVLMHGANGTGSAMVAGFQGLADEFGIVLLAPDSRGITWDMVWGDFGEDVLFITEALKRTYARVNVDATRTAVGGFSDGASMSLSLGVTNGDLFTDVIGWSPGFIEHQALYGKPPVFISHGVNDQILPVSRSRQIVPYLEDRGYTVTYREFDGGHVIPLAIAREAIEAIVATA